MPEDLHPKVVHDALPQIGGQQRLAILDQELQQQSTGKDRGEGTEQPRVSCRYGDIECPLGEDGADQREPGSEQEKQHREGCETSVRLQIGQQAPQQPGVVALLENLVLVHTLYPAGSASAVSST